MKLAILSTFPYFDNLYYKQYLLTKLIQKKPQKLYIIYSHTKLFDYYNEIKSRVNEIPFFLSRYLTCNDLNKKSLIENKKLYKISQENNISVSYFNRFSDDNCVDLLSQHNFDVIFNISGAYIPEVVLEKSRFGVIGAHYGYLPNIRGLDSIRWTIYLNRKLYVSHQILSKQYDMGDIVRREKVHIEAGEDIQSIRKKCQFLAAKGFLDIYDKLLTQSLKKIPQKISQGNTYYKMNKYFRRKTDFILTNRKYKHYE